MPLANMTQTSIILTYKGKVLLFSRDILLNPTESTWDFLKISSSKKKAVLDFLKKEINFVCAQNLEDENIFPVDTDRDETSLLHVKMTDENVNSLSRKEGWRLEFYRINELDKILLSNEARMIVDKYIDQLKSAIMKSL